MVKFETFPVSATVVYVDTGRKFIPYDTLVDTLAN